jgi:exonuclease SbcD
LKVIHLADLHIGKPFHKKSLLLDQSYMLKKVLDLMKSQKAHLVIAGDVFDSANPSIDAQEVFVSFIKEIVKLCDAYNLTTIIIVGNHDSNRRLALWEDFVGTRVHIVNDAAEILIDGIPFYAVSFVKPTIAQTRFNRPFETYNEAFKAYLPETNRENTILIAHQTFEGCTTGSSEAMSFFDDAVSKQIVQEFPLVLAGHIHKKQKIGNIFYPGSLMPYAFGDEYAGGITVWDIIAGTDGKLAVSSSIYPVPLYREFQIVRGDLKHCLSIVDTEAYIKVELVDENVPLDVALPQLQNHFKNMVTAVSKITDDWEADLNKPMVQFDSIESALDSFCNQIEVPVLESEQLRLVQEVVHEITETSD